MAYTLEYTGYYYQQHPTAAKSKGLSVAAILGFIGIFIAIGIVCSDSTCTLLPLLLNLQEFY